MRAMGRAQLPADLSRFAVRGAPGGRGRRANGITSSVLSHRRSEHRDSADIAVAVLALHEHRGHHPRRSQLMVGTLPPRGGSTGRFGQDALRACAGYSVVAWGCFPPTHPPLWRAQELNRCKIHRCNGVSTAISALNAILKFSVVRARCGRRTALWRSAMEAQTSEGRRRRLPNNRRNQGVIAYFAAFRQDVFASSAIVIPAHVRARPRVCRPIDAGP